MGSRRIGEFLLMTCIVLAQLMSAFSRESVVEAWGIVDTSTPLASTFVTACTTDSECGDSNYCFEGVCERCIPCQQFNRQPPPEAGGCARYEDACGPCFNGFRAEFLLDRKHSYSCQPVVYNERSRGVMDAPVWLWFLVLAAIVGIVVFIKQLKMRSAAARMNEMQPNPLTDGPSKCSFHDTARTGQVIVVQEVHVQATPIGRFGDSNDQTDSDVESVAAKIPPVYDPESSPNGNESRTVPAPVLNRVVILTDECKYPDTCEGGCPSQMEGAVVDSSRVFHDAEPKSLHPLAVDEQLSSKDQLSSRPVLRSLSATG